MLVLHSLNAQHFFQTREVRNDEVFPVLDSPLAGSEGLQSAVIHPVSTVDTEIEFNVSPKATPLREEKKKDLSRTSVHIPDFLELVSVEYMCCGCVPHKGVRPCSNS